MTYNANKTAISWMVINKYNTRQWYHVSCRNGHTGSVRLQNLYCVSNTRLWWNTGPWHGLLCRNANKTAIFAMVINGESTSQLYHWSREVSTVEDCGISTVWAMEIIQGYGISSPLALYRIYSLTPDFAIKKKWLLLANHGFVTRFQLKFMINCLRNEIPLSMTELK